MQLSARILTALAVLAFTVAVVAGRGATDEVSAATGMIDALNVGACTTTNADVLDIGDCTNTMAFFEGGELSEAIEVDDLYATYAHDPKTAAEAPRGIIANADLIKISIKDSDRDRRDPVLIAVENGGMNITSNATTPATNVFVDGDAQMAGDQWVLNTADGSGDAADSSAREVVADSVGADPDNLSDLELEMAHFGAQMSITTSGSYTFVFQGGTYHPIAPDGVVKFFGTVDGGAFMDIGGNVKLDEDVISGDTDVAPAMVLNISVPTSVVLQVIYYQTSDVENLVGGAVYNADSMMMKHEVVFTSDEMKNDTPLLVQASSDGNDGDANLYLMETGRFDGVYQGYLRLTDADGDGGGGTDGNWGDAVGDGMTDNSVDNAAVLGVGNGPVIINYRDSDGQNRSFEIQIDIDPPVITVDSPVHNSRSDDEKPSFIGTINDGDSGLAADTFQLYVNNTGKDEEVLSIDAGVGPDADDGNTDGIDRRLEYTGYDSMDKFGVIGADQWMPEMDEEYKSVEADGYADGAPDGEFADEIEIDFDEDDENFVAFNHKIKFQALVRDLAGNVGFSDSDPAKPRFINDLGEKAPRSKPNVLGVFSSHAVWLDEVDPYIHANRTTTGFYGLDDDDMPVRNRSAVMIVFDNDVNGSLIDAGTFTLEYDDESPIGIADVMVDGELVFLMLDEELASDATPTLSITEGREVEDFAGNILSSTEHILDPDDSDDRVSSFMVKDGILPVFTLTLIGGSGIGVGSEGPAQLTNETIDIAIESDEDITGAPRVAVVCSNIGWTDGDTDKDLDDYVGNRTGYDDDMANETGLMCGDEAINASGSSSLSRPGNNWVYAWRAPDDVPDGGVTVVVWGRDRGGFEYYMGADGTRARENWGSQTAEFTLDTMFNSPLESSGGDVQPDPGSDVAEPRPFVLLDFAGERTNVSVTKLTVDGEDVLGSLDDIGDNRFLYWPETLEYGEHTVVFDARDAADNKKEGVTFSFDVTARDPFVLDITAGWNAISFPADPVDTALDSVFTEDAIDRVVGWNPMSSTGPWSIASRVDGVWTTSESFAPLTDVTARYGYWVHSTAFIMQSVNLVGPIDRETGGKPVPRGIPTIPGWNFVGVVDQDGDQTEGHFGESLMDSEMAVVNADDYMPGYVRAYTWDAIGNGYRVLEDGDAVTIGDGIWVFFPDGTTVAP